MNRFMTGAAAVLMAGATTHAGATFSATRTGTNINGTGFDEITFRVTGFNELVSPDASTPNNGISGIQGTFSAIGAGAELSVPGTTEAQARGRTTNADFEARETPAESYTNFDSVGTFTSGPGVFARTPALDQTPAAFTGTWFSAGNEFYLRPIDNADANGIDNTILAQIYVSAGADVSFSGLFNTTTGPTGVNQPINVTSVPEPAGLAVLATAALLAGVRGTRRRR